MNLLAQIEKLLVVSQAKYDHQKQTFAKILAEEMRVRQELTRLGELGQNTANEETDLIGMRAIGADILWQGWLSRSKSALNMELARILAIKAHEQTKVRKAFGKVIALQELIREEKKMQKKKSAQRALSLVIDHASQQ